MKFLESGVYTNDIDKRECCLVRMMAMQYILYGGQLYQRSYDDIQLHCLKKEKAEKVMEEVLQGISGPHMNGRMLAKKIPMMGYYWNTKKIDYVGFVKSCHDCQTYANLNHVPPGELYSMTSPWPFSIWGTNVIERVASKVSNGHECILVAIDHFIMWVEAASYYVLKAKHMARFIENNIIYRFGVPREIILNNGSHFEGEVQRIMELYNIEHHKSLPYRLQTNRAIKATNKNTKNILAKMVVTYKDWAEKLSFSLWGYRTSIHGQPPTLWFIGVK